MKKILLFIVLSGSMPSLNAQSQGHVGINTPTPTATLHVKANGSTNATQALKLESSTGTNLLTISDDGTVSGTAATNLMSGTATAPKGSGMFLSRATSLGDGYLSPAGNSYVASFSTNAFYDVAQTVSYTTVIDLPTLTVRPSSVNPFNSVFVIDLFVNGVFTGNQVSVFIPANAPVANYTSLPVPSFFIILQKGDLFAYRFVSSSNSVSIRTSVSVRYTEQ